MLFLCFIDHSAKSNRFSPEAPILSFESSNLSVLRGNNYNILSFQCFVRFSPFVDFTIHVVVRRSSMAFLFWCLRIRSTLKESVSPITKAARAAGTSDTSGVSGYPRASREHQLQPMGCIPRRPCPMTDCYLLLRSLANFCGYSIVIISAYACW